jgi:predicted site-specific integrase-resolvase
LIIIDIYIKKYINVIMKAKQVLSLTGIRRETLSRLVRQGTISAMRTPNGRYEYDDESVYRYMGKKREQLFVIYARVSTTKQKADLANQIAQLENYCAAKGYKTDMVFSDIASGIDFDKRKDFFRLLNLVIQYKVSKVFVTYKDRLSRVGFGLFGHLFRQFGCQIEVIHDAGNEKLGSQEIFEEIMTLIHCFPMKHYAKRRLDRRIRQVIRNEKDTEDKNTESDPQRV